MTTIDATVARLMAQAWDIAINPDGFEAALRAALTEAQPVPPAAVQGEPVAWMYEQDAINDRQSDAGWVPYKYTELHNNPKHPKIAKHTPLYTTPQPFIAQPVQPATAINAAAINHAHSLALELETLLYWVGKSSPNQDSAVQVLENYRKEMRMAHESSSPTFMGEPAIASNGAL